MSKPTTYAAEYKKQVNRILPQHADQLIGALESLEGEYGDKVTPDEVEDWIFSAYGEYLGGMATAINAMIHANAYKTGEDA
jgi:hypothetical protein